jgi:hypothetical protein
MNGKDAASARYIFTHLTNTTQILFNSNDTPLLKMLDDYFKDNPEIDTSHVSEFLLENRPIKEKSILVIKQNK